MSFIQIIEMHTSNGDRIQELADEWVVATTGKRTARRSTLMADRDKPNTYVQMVEFPSYEEAMANSRLPETSQLADRLAELCDEAPIFHNLEIVRVEDLA